MHANCQTGGRYLHWLGYRTDEIPATPEAFRHVADQQPLAVQAWRPKQPNGQKSDQCLVAYLGLEFDVSWYA